MIDSFDSSGALKKILIRSPNWLGDHIMAFDLYRALRKYYAKTKLTLLCSKAVSSLPENAIFDDKIELSDHERRFSSDYFKIAKDLKERQFDLAITLPASLSAAILPFLASIPIRVGFLSGLNQFFLTSGISWGGVTAGKHKAALYRALFDFVTGTHFTALDEADQTVSPREKLFVVAPGASIALREWPYYPELLLDLEKKFPAYRIVVVGTPHELKWRSQFKRVGLRRTEDFFGRTSLVEVIELCSRAAVVVANDSGIAHLAASVSNAPTVVLFGPGDPRYVKPIGNRVRVVRTEIPCSPCESAHCKAPFGYQRCLKEISVEAVVATMSECLQ